MIRKRKINFKKTKWQKLRIHRSSKGQEINNQRNGKNIKSNEIVLSADFQKLKNSTT